MIKKDLALLRTILDKVQQANKKLYSKDTAFCLRRNNGTALDYYDRTGKCLIDLEREIGTEICFYRDVEKQLINFIEYQSYKAGKK